MAGRCVGGASSAASGCSSSFLTATRQACCHGHPNHDNICNVIGGVRQRDGVIGPGVLTAFRSPNQLKPVRILDQEQNPGSEYTLSVVWDLRHHAGGDAF